MTTGTAHEISPEFAARIAAVRAKAKRRYWLVVVVAGLAGALLGPVVRSVTGPSSHHAHRSHPTAARVAIVVLVLIALLAVGVALWVWIFKRVLRDENGRRDWPPLVYGLPRDDRRCVRRAIRTGQPSGDDLLRYVETGTCRKLLRLRRVNQAILAVGALGGLAIVIANWSNHRLTISWLILLVLVAAGCLNQQRYLRGAARYLRAVDGAGSETA